MCEGEGRSTSFTCVLDSNISRSNLHWYRILKDTGTVEKIQRNQKDMPVVPIFNNNSFNTTLYILSANRFYTGFYWVRLSSGDVCNVSLTVTTSMFICVTYVDKYNTIHM